MELMTVWTNPRLAILEAAATSPTWYPKISFKQMARHRKSSLCGRCIACFDEFIQKKIPHNLAVLSSSFKLWSDNVNWNSCIMLISRKTFNTALFWDSLIRLNYTPKAWNCVDLLQILMVHEESRYGFPPDMHTTIRILSLKLGHMFEQWS